MEASAVLEQCPQGSPDEAPCAPFSPLVLPIAIIASGIVFLDGTIVNVALPSIRAGLHGGLADQQWVVEAYLLALSALLLVGGALGDGLGRRRTLIAGVSGFGVCSAACALAPDAHFLIVARALQGVAGALLVPNTLALVSDRYPADERPAAIGSWTAWTGIATIIGPLGGGALLGVTSWRAIFAVNLIPVLVVLALLHRIAPDQTKSRHIDLPGALLCAGGLGGPVFALIEQPSHGWGAPLVLVPLLGGLLIGAAFLAWERLSPEPMLPLGLFRVRDFSVGNLTTLLLYGALGMVMFVLVIFLQQVAGYSPLGAGCSLLPVTFAVFLISRRAGALADRHGPRLFMAAGPLIAGGGMAWVGLAASAHTSYLSDLLPSVTVFGIGLGLTVAPLTSTVLAAVDRQHAGLASGVNNAVARVASLLTVAVLGALLSVAFDGRLEHAIATRPAAPAVVSFLRAAEPRPLVVSTQGAPARDVPQIRGVLLDASIHAFRVAALVAAALAALGGLVSLVGLERRGRARPARRSSG